MNLKEFEIAVHDAFAHVLIKTECDIATLYIGHKDYLDIKADLHIKYGMDIENQFSPFTENGPDFIWHGIPGYMVRQSRHFGYQIQIK